MNTPEDNQNLRLEFVTRAEFAEALRDIEAAVRRAVDAAQTAGVRQVAARLADAADTVAACQHDITKTGQP